MSSLITFQFFITVLGCLVIFFEQAVMGAHHVNDVKNQKSSNQFSTHTNFPVPQLQTLYSFTIPNFIKTSGNGTQKKEPRFLSSLFNSDTMKCAPQVMCELITAKEPGPKTNTVNDFKYLVKEIFLKSESSEDDDVDDMNKKIVGNNKLRSTDSMPNQKQTVKTKDIDGSSSEESLSLPSREVDQPEDKTNGVAELMALEEEEEIENKVIDDMVGGNSHHLVFALADAKRKHKLQEIAANRLNSKRFQRNVAILEKTLAENRKQHIFRTSRAMESRIIERKAKELQKTTNMMDRVRIAAEVAGTTRSARKCRALFDPCSESTQGIQNMVKNLRNQISGGLNNQNSGITMNDVTTLFREVQSWNSAKSTGESGADVKVVLNIGGPSPSMQESVLANQQTHMNYWPQLIPSVIPTPTVASKEMSSTTTERVLSVNDTKTKPSVNVHRHSDWPKLIKNVSNTTVRSDQHPNAVKDQYKQNLQQASNILRKLPLVLPKNFTHSRSSTLKSASVNTVSHQLPKHDSLESSDSESNSLESSEEFGNISPLRTDLPYGKNEWPTSPNLRGLELKSQSRFSRILTSVPASSYGGLVQKAQGSSWVSKIYDTFYRKVSPLPVSSQEWLPYSQRYPLRRHNQRFMVSSRVPFRFTPHHPPLQQDPFLAGPRPRPRKRLSVQRFTTSNPSAKAEISHKSRQSIKLKNKTEKRQY